MIFAMFGTNPYPFTRLAKGLDDFAGKTGCHVEVQCGHTKYGFHHCQATPFLPHNDILKKIGEAECLIVQGGAGSISDGLRSGRPLVAVPRSPDFLESPDRQVELVRKLEVMGCLTAVYDIADLELKINEAKYKKAVRPPANRVPAIIREYLEEL